MPIPKIPLRSLSLPVAIHVWNGFIVYLRDGTDEDTHAGLRRYGDVDPKSYNSIVSILGYLSRLVTPESVLSHRCHLPILVTCYSEQRCFIGCGLNWCWIRWVWSSAHSSIKVEPKSSYQHGNKSVSFFMFRVDNKCFVEYKLLKHNEIKCLGRVGQSFFTSSVVWSWKLLQMCYTYKCSICWEKWELDGILFHCNIIWPSLTAEGKACVHNESLVLTSATSYSPVCCSSIETLNILLLQT